MVSARHFDSWWKTARQQTPDLLTFSPELLVTTGAGQVSGEDYPDTWQQYDLANAMNLHLP